MVFIDSDDHQEELVMAEVIALKPRLEHGALVFFHDFGNQYHGPKNAYRHVVENWGWEPVEIPDDEARGLAAGYEADNDSWHMPGESAPCYVGCLRVP